MKRPTRGSAELALRIAEDEAERCLAVKQFGSLKFAPATIDTKDSLFGLWGKICERLHLESLPVTERSINEVTAILRASGYRAAMAYVYEAKTRHAQEGHEWNDRLQMALTDAKRAAKRALGPPTRAEEIRPEWWSQVAVKCGKEPREIEFEADEPAGGLRVWVLATKFLLRETELAGLTVDSDGIHLDRTAMTVSLHLDPTAKGTWRTLACSCGKKHPSVCPYHTGLDLVNLQLRAHRLTRQDEAKGKGYPLIGRLDNAKAFVEKEKMISHAKKFGTLVSRVAQEAKELDIERVRALCKKIWCEGPGETRHSADCNTMDGKALLKCNAAVRGRCLV